jgi:hypothetical protein
MVYHGTSNYCIVVYHSKLWYTIKCTTLYKSYTIVSYGIPWTSYHCAVVHHSKLWFTTVVYHVVKVAYHSKNMVNYDIPSTSYHCRVVHYSKLRFTTVVYHVSGASRQKWTAFCDTSAKIGTIEGHVILINLRPRDILRNTAFWLHFKKIQDGGQITKKLHILACRRDKSEIQIAIHMFSGSRNTMGSIWIPHSVMESRKWKIAAIYRKWIYNVYLSLLRW